ncbi:MAG: ABC transporter ATP-binding protein [Phycisphaerae bacterium]|nr:ABC transporter ATP-binding protein [Phycisphaerae bacterium]
MNNWVIQTQDVHKGFKGKQVLLGVDLNVPHGSVVGLLGKNGAGKTTLIKCLLGLFRLDDGEITLLGEDPWTLSAAAKERLGYVPQEVSLYPWMKVQQVVAYTGAFYPRWNKALIERLIKEWELDPDAKVSPLSVGERQKLAILLALGHEPELLVLDEPAASLDPVARREFLRAILEITSDRARTVLFSTHITSDLERVADRVAILKDGKIIYHDELGRLKDSVKRLQISAASPLPTSLNIPGTLRCEVDGQEALVSVRDLNDQVVDGIRERWNATVQVRDLNLEDIFLEMHHV